MYTSNKGDKMKVIKPFIEKFDSNHNYKVGDEYPRDGFEPPNGRIEALQAPVKNKYNSIGDQFLEVKKKTGRPPKEED